MSFCEDCSEYVVWGAEDGLIVFVRWALARFGSMLRGRTALGGVGLDAIVLFGVLWGMFSAGGPGFGRASPLVGFVSLVVVYVGVGGVEVYFFRFV